MSPGICAAVTEDIALGLSLSGVSDIYMHEKTPKEKELKEWYRSKAGSGVDLMILSPSAGVVLSKELFKRRISGELLPITVIIPGEEEDKRASDLIKRAIGMDPSRKDKEK